MNIITITRLPAQVSYDEQPWCDTFVGLSTDAAKAKAVSMMTDWFNEQVWLGEEEETTDSNVIFDKYVAFWEDEEIWTIEEHSV